MKSTLFDPSDIPESARPAYERLCQRIEGLVRQAMDLEDEARRLLTRTGIGLVQEGQRRQETRKRNGLRLVRFRELS